MVDVSLPKPMFSKRLSIMATMCSLIVLSTTEFVRVSSSIFVSFSDSII
jgi:hypothetical protein